MKLRDRKWERKHVIAAVAGVTLLAAAFFAVFGVQKEEDRAVITIEQGSEKKEIQGQALKRQEHDPSQEALSQSSPPTHDSEGTASEGAIGVKGLMVDVDGAVKKPGVFTLQEGDRVFQALELAGGISEDADTSSVNLARMVEDGEKIYVPTKSESSMPSAAGADSTIKQNGSTPSPGKININKAGSAELQQLPGIGPATAEKILEYRRQNGKFNQAEDLKNVSGIGEKTFARFREKISV